MFDVSIYRLIKSLKPIDLFEIITRNTCRHYLDDIKKQIISIKGEWFINNWDRSTVLDILDLYLSDTSFSLSVKKEEAKRLETEFNSWNLFYDVYILWYGGTTYKVGFSYTQENFMILYKEWLRNKNLDILLENGIK